MRTVCLRPLLRLGLALLVLLVPLAASGPARAKEDMTRVERAAAKQRTRIASVWLDLAKDLAKRGLPAEARDALEKARALDPEHKRLEKVGALVEDAGDDGTLDDAARKRIEKARHDAAKGYDRLSDVFKKEQNDPRFAGYLVQAFGLEASKSRLKKLSELAKKDLLLLRSPSHPMVALVSFPKGWKRGKEWPVLVSVEGAGSNFPGNAHAFKIARGSRRFITVCPHALSCTNDIKLDRYPAYPRSLIDEWNGDRTGFDVPGLVALLDFLHEHFGASKKVAITGFSGGGNLCYSLILKHPDRILCAAPACANFQPGLAADAVTPEDGGPPIHILTGEKDPHRHLTHGKTPPGIEEQTDMAVKAFEENGFTNVKRTMLDGVGHSKCARQVWAFVDEVLER